MKKIVISLTDAEYSAIEAEAQVQGFRPSTFAKFKVMSNHQNLTANFLGLRKNIISTINHMPCGKTFIISALFPPSEWREFTRSTKNTASMQLKSLSTKNPDVLEIIGKTHDKTNIYKKISTKII